VGTVTRRLAPDDLVVCSGTIGRVPIDVAAQLAAEAGFHGISVYYEDYRAARAGGWTDADLRSLLAGYGVAVAELDGPMRWLPGDVAGPGVDEFVAAAAALAARSITVLEVRGRRVGEVVPYDAVAAAFAAVCERAARHDLLAHIEYFPMSGIPDLTTAWEVIRRAGQPNGGIMVDSWHHLRGPDAGVLHPEVPGAAILAVQVSDVAAEPSPDVAHEMMHDRLLPGSGAGDVAGLVRLLRARGCTAPLEIEVYSDELSLGGPALAARRAAAALRAIADAPGGR
jgi:sugar phosphate isomerase/epimerase